MKMFSIHIKGQFQDKVEFNWADRFLVADIEDAMLIAASVRENIKGWGKGKKRSIKITDVHVTEMTD